MKSNTFSKEVDPVRIRLIHMCPSDRAGIREIARVKADEDRYQVIDEGYLEMGSEES